MSIEGFVLVGYLSIIAKVHCDSRVFSLSEDTSRTDLSLLKKKRDQIGEEYQCTRKCLSPYLMQAGLTSWSKTEENKNSKKQTWSHECLLSTPEKAHCTW